MIVGSKVSILLRGLKFTLSPNRKNIHLERFTEHLGASITNLALVGF